MKAVEIRAVAETVSNPVARRDLLSLAERFERLADQLEIWVSQAQRIAHDHESRDKR